MTRPFGDDTAQIPGSDVSRIMSASGVVRSASREFDRQLQCRLCRQPHVSIARPLLLHQAQVIPGAAVRVQQRPVVTQHKHTVSLLLRHQPRKPFLWRGVTFLQVGSVGPPYGIQPRSHQPQLAPIRLEHLLLPCCHLHRRRTVHEPEHAHRGKHGQRHEQDEEACGHGAGACVSLSTMPARFNQARGTEAVMRSGRALDEYARECEPLALMRQNVSPLSFVLGSLVPVVGCWSLVRPGRQRQFTVCALNPNECRGTADHEPRTKNGPSTTDESTKYSTRF